jgi:Heterokaryon incompatibility protein (HET)
VCIDQGNLPERSHQVQAMSKIYKQAHKTLVWLGEDDRFSKDAYAALGKVRDQLN